VSLIRFFFSLREEFGKEVKELNFADKLTFDFPSNIERHLVGQCEFAYDHRWWRSDVFRGAFQNPRDSRRLWKEIDIKLPNDGFIYSPRHESQKTKLDRSSQVLFEKMVTEVFPSLLPGKLMRFNYFNIHKDRLSIYFEDHTKKEKLQLTFEYFPPVGDA
jgi:hypothetical protein